MICTVSWSSLAWKASADYVSVQLIAGGAISDGICHNGAARKAPLILTRCQHLLAEGALLDLRKCSADQSHPCKPKGWAKQTGWSHLAITAGFKSKALLLNCIMFVMGKTLPCLAIVNVHFFHLCLLHGGSQPLPAAVLEAASVESWYEQNCRILNVLMEPSCPAWFVAFKVEFCTSSWSSSFEH